MRKKIGLSVSDELCQNFKILAVFNKNDLTEFFNNKLLNYINNYKSYNYYECLKLDTNKISDSNLNFRIDSKIYENIEELAKLHFRSVKQEIKLMIYSIYLIEIENKKIKILLNLK